MPIEDKKGFSLIELVIALSAAMVLLVAVGRTMDLVERTPGLSAARAEASRAAQEGIEAVNLAKNSLFACRCAVDACAGDTCVRAGDLETCRLLPGYAGCWTEYPSGAAGETEFKVSQSGTGWILSPSGGADDIIRAEPYLARRVRIENARRSASGELSESGTVDPGSKYVISTASWRDRNGIKSVEYRLLITAWENL